MVSVYFIRVASTEVLLTSTSSISDIYSWLGNSFLQVCVSDIFIYMWLLVLYVTFGGYIVPCMNPLIQTWLLKTVLFSRLFTWISIGVCRLGIVCYSSGVTHEGSPGDDLECTEDAYIMFSGDICVPL